ncbi:MAG TPA: TIGR00725 family protein [Spirochaetota bacterium]|nr:TIGR00725 family protein [Spirochaetota bacterium]
MRRRQVVVIGAGDAGFVKEAYELGRHVASRGWVLVSGGRGGVMESASRGASEAGGTVVGILPGDDLDGANQYCDIVIPTGIGYARNLANVLSGDAVVAFGGKSGTLSEMAFAWQFGRPLIVCAFSGGWSARMGDAPVDDRPGDMHVARDLAEVFSLLERVMARE